MSTHRLSLSFIFFHIFLIFPSRILAIRKNAGLEIISTCRSTVQGRYLLTDDNGYVCDALSVDPLSHCCFRKGEKFPCHGCNLVSQCCNSYEYCVSCCQNPSRTTREQILKIKIAKPATAGTYTSVFDFCVGRCRHNSESVVSIPEPLFSMGRVTRSHLTKWLSLPSKLLSRKKFLISF